MSRKPVSWSILSLAMATVLLAGIPEPVRAESPPENPLDAKCELGITLALAGETASAESVFISLLSDDPTDPRSYVNLGNVHFLRGDLDVALVFYDMAIGRDTTDAGIRLNRATTLMLKGEDAAAQEEADLAVAMAGGPEAASALLGLKGPSTGKAAEKAYVSKEEVRQLLSGSMMPKETAASDSLPAADGEDPAAPVKKRARVWGSSAPRAAEDTEAASVLYWKY